MFSFVNTTLTYGGNVTGTLTVDTTTGRLSNIDVLVDSFLPFGGSPANQYLTPDMVTGPFSAATWFDLVDTGRIQYQGVLNTIFPTGLVNYAGGPLCSVSYACTDPSTGSTVISVFLYYTTLDGRRNPLPTGAQIEAGSLVPSATTVVTPEPASWLLTGTALLALGMLVFARRPALGLPGYD